MQKFTTAQRIRQIMSERNLKQIDIVKLAEPYCKKYKSKLGRNDLSQYLSGKSNPGQSKLYILSCALDVNEAWLMGYDVDRNRTDKNVTTQSKESKFELSHHEQKVIKHYRQKPEMQPAVDKLLGIEDNESKNTPAPKNFTPNIAAASGKEIKAKKLDIDTMIEIEKMK